MDSTDEILSDPVLREEVLKGIDEAKAWKTKILVDIKKELGFDQPKL